MPGLPRAQRDPAHGAIRERGTSGGAGPDAEKCDEGGCIDGPSFGAFLTRHPAPAVPDVSPATVVRRGETPGGAVDPGPAPWGDIRPLAIAVWNPVVGHRRIPDLPVIRGLRPFPIGIEIAAARHRRDLRWDRSAPGWRSLGVQARGEERGARYRADAALELIRAGDRGGLIGADPERNAWAFDLGRALQHRHEGGLVSGAGDDVIAAVLRDPHQTARGLHGPGLRRREIGEASVKLALGHDGLRSGGVQAGHVEFGLTGEGDASVGEFQFRARVGLGPEGVAGADREILAGGAPLRVGAGAEGDGAGHAGHPADLGWRVTLVLVGLRGGWRARLRGRGVMGDGVAKQGAEGDGGGEAEEAWVCGHHNGP
jgi:hypothetical protein